jgi:phosphoribosylcarboxyaminoimidazole (NCAIR) mutase
MRIISAHNTFDIDVHIMRIISAHKTFDIDVHTCNMRIISAHKTFDIDVHTFYYEDNICPHDI